MTARERLPLSNALDALDRLFDGHSSIIDLQALLFATGEALRGTSYLPHFEHPAARLLAVIRSREPVDATRDEALAITDKLRRYLAQIAPES